MTKLLELGRVAVEPVVEEVAEEVTALTPNLTVANLFKKFIPLWVLRDTAKKAGENFLPSLTSNRVRSNWASL